MSANTERVFMHMQINQKHLNQLIAVAFHESLNVK